MASILDKAVGSFIQYRHDYLHFVRHRQLITYKWIIVWSIALYVLCNNILIL